MYGTTLMALPIVLLQVVKVVAAMMRMLSMIRVGTTKLVMR
jgi:hypothetical protein